MNDEAEANVRVEKAGPVTTVILARPAVRNAVDRRTADALLRIFTDFEQDASAQVAVLWGEGGNFCAGADLKAVAAGDFNRIEPEVGPLGPTRMLLGKPVIAAVEGHAVAGGLELALWCDLRVADETAVFGVYCRRWGVPLLDGGTVRLPRLVGLGRALDLVLTGRPVPAAEALQMGLANRVVPAGTARQAAEQLAQQIAEFPPVCMRNDRLSAHEQYDFTLPEALLNEHRRGLESLQAESLSGAQRFASGAGRHGAFGEVKSEK
jgi:enoyl-CoA hydratase